MQIKESLIKRIRNLLMRNKSVFQQHNKLKPLPNFGSGLLSVINLCNVLFNYSIFLVGIQQLILMLYLWYNF